MMLLNKYGITTVRMFFSPIVFGFISLWGGFIFGSPPHTGSDAFTRRELIMGSMQRKQRETIVLDMELGKVKA